MALNGQRRRPQALGGQRRAGRLGSTTEKAAENVEQSVSESTVAQETQEAVEAPASPVSPTTTATPETQPPPKGVLGLR